MSGLIVFLLILAAVLASVGLMVWKVLKGPIVRPAEPEPQPEEPVIERKSLESPDPFHVAGPAEEVAASPQSVRPSPYSDRRPPEPVPTRFTPPPPERETADPNIAGIAATTAGIVGFAALTGWLVLPYGALARMAGRRRTSPNYRRSPLIQSGGREIPVLNVSVLGSGRIVVEGRETTAEQLGTQLANLKSRGGKVRYYCEPVEPRPPQAAEVMGLLVNLGVPFTSGGKTVAQRQ
jgi:hypothetical protein